MSTTLKGVFAIVAAAVIWGLAPLYYKLIADVPPVEVLAHRTLWSLVSFCAALVFQRLGEIGGFSPRCGHWPSWRWPV